MQGAPARAARGMSLPQVVAEGSPPFVVATRFPNGYVAVATLPRTSAEKGVRTPPADVALEVGEAAGALGVFGRYRTLTLKLSTPLGARRIWAQDLAGDVAIDVTEQVQSKNGTLALTGELITQVGLSAASAHDTSDPGLVLVLKKP